MIVVKEEKKEYLEKMHEIETQLHIAKGNLERLHEVETQLHDAKEALAKYVHEKEVRNSCLSAIYSQYECVGSFERHTRGIGSKLLMNMAMKVKDWENMNKA